MKKQLIILITSLFVIIIGVVFYMNFLKKEVETSILEQVPASKPHKHITPDGEVVQHTHTPIQPPKTNPQQGTKNDKKETVPPILRIWKNLDLNEIRRKYQPYTVQELIDKWDEKYLDFQRVYRNPTLQVSYEEDEAYWPKEQWLQHLLDIGFPLATWPNYYAAFNTRGRVMMNKDRYDDPEKRSRLLDGHFLPEDTTWEEMKDLTIKFDLVARLNEIRAKEVDPSVSGGTMNLKGVFTPFTSNTVHVYISEETGAAKFTGRLLTQQQKDDLTMYGVAPEGITVVYTDKDDRPLPADKKPRFYEQEMAAIEAAIEAIEAHTQQMIAEHETFFNTIPQQSHENTQIQQLPSAQRVPQDPDLRDEAEPSEPQRPSKTTIPMQNIPPEMLPKEPPSRKNMQDWLELLQELHGGELPRDLRMLKEALTELEAIRQAAQEKLAPMHGTPK